jgi:chromosome segregation ATPase
MGKFERDTSICFLEQMSSGQSSFIGFLFLISIRIVNQVLIYIFDEIDANLDSYSTLLFSYLLNEISSFGVQILASTYNKDFIANADKWFGVSNTYKGSYIKNLRKSTALKFNKINNKSK